MKAVKSLLAISILAAAASAHAVVSPITGVLVSQTPPVGSQTLSGNLNFTGSIDVDMGTGTLYALALTTVGSYTSTSSLGPVVTFYSNANWNASLGSGLSVGYFGAATAGATAGAVYSAQYDWGTNSVDSNAAGSFSEVTPHTCTGANCSFAMAGNPAWDVARLTVDLDAGLAVVGIRFSTTEVGQFGSTSSAYTLAQAPAVPVPAAAWLFGSGLLGLAGTARRRRNSEVA